MTVQALKFFRKLKQFAPANDKKHFDVVEQALEELEQYRALGTVEELKDAREKQVAKKPIDNGMRSGIFATRKYYSCPRCGNACLQKMANERQNTNYCWDCGQALKWGEEDD